MDNQLTAPLFSSIVFSELDGKNIVTAQQFQLLQNLNLTLIEYDDHSNLVSLLAEDFNVNGNDITFTIRKNVKTISGHEITARDAEISLKRLILSDHGTHSRLTQLLCNEEKKNGNCPSITSDGYKLKISAKKTSYIPFILHLLTSADNVIIPITALENENFDSKIINFSETTGPYYLEKTLDNGIEINSFNLLLNRTSFLATDNSPFKISYIKSDIKEIISVDGVLNKKFNYVQSVTGVFIKDVEKLIENDSSATIYRTQPIKNTVIFSSTNSRKKFSPLELLSLENSIRNYLLLSKEHYPNITKEQIEYFPSESEGQLTADQKIEFDKYLNQAKALKLNHKITLGLYAANFERFGKTFEKNPNIHIIKLDSYKDEQKVDFYLDVIDSSFIESLDLLQYGKSYDIFKINDNQIQEYIDLPLKEDRVRLLKKIHYDSLISGNFMVVGSAPYITILNNKWETNTPRFFSTHPVWKIKKKI